MGFLAGAGWERYSGDATLMVPGPEGLQEPGVSSGKLASERRLLFLGGSRTFVVLQVSLEAGLAEGFDPVLPPLRKPALDPSTRSLFGALSFRLTF